MNEAQHSLQTWLESFAASQGAAAGTVHVRRGEDLVLAAAHNIPQKVLEAMRHVPHGEGMAGLAQVRRQPVHTADLHADRAGHIMPVSQAARVGAGVALPVLDAAGEVRAVVGIAFVEQEQIPFERERALMAAAAHLPLVDP